MDGAIRQHVDEHRWKVEKKIEAEEREGLRNLTDVWRRKDDDDTPGI